MPKKEYVHIAILIDRSGSMASIAKDMEGGIKTLLQDQKESPGTVSVSLAKFDDQYELVYDFAKIEDCSDFEIKPRGGTALYDASFFLIDGVSKKIQLMDSDEMPEKVLVVIITDGQNNVSKSFDAKTIKDLISSKQVREENHPAWEFVFLGANFDVEQEAVQGLNVAVNSTLNYSTDSVMNTMQSLSQSITRYRSLNQTHLCFTNEERAASNPNLNSKTNTNITI